jgi:hypothetical protein
MGDALMPNVLEPTPKPDITVKPFQTGFLFQAHSARAKQHFWDTFDSEPLLPVTNHDVLAVVEQLWCTGLRIEYQRYGGEPWTS